MKKILFTLALLISFSSFGHTAEDYFDSALEKYKKEDLNESISESISISSTIENPDFRGVWKVIGEDEVVFGFQIIWKDSRGQYKSIYMDLDNETTHTKDVYLKNNKLIIKPVFLKTNWEVTKVLMIIDENTISVEGINESGTFTQTLIRI